MDAFCIGSIQSGNVAASRKTKNNVVPKEGVLYSMANSTWLGKKSAAHDSPLSANYPRYMRFIGKQKTATGFLSLFRSEAGGYIESFTHGQLDEMKIEPVDESEKKPKRKKK